MQEKEGEKELDNAAATILDQDTNFDFSKMRIEPYDTNEFLNNMLTSDFRMREFNE